MFRLLIVLLLLFGVGCSDEDNKVEDHILKDQADMIKKAKGVEQMLNDAALQQQKTIDQQSH